MKSAYLLCTLIAATLFFGGCKKDDEPSNTDKLTGKNWKLSASTVDPALPSGGTLYTNIFPLIADCAKDNLLTFGADKKYTMDEGGARCNTTDPQIAQSGTWSWVSNETIIRVVLDGGGGTTEYTVQELSDSRLKVTYTERLTSGGVTNTYTVTDTFTKQ